ncbi:Dynamin [Pseudomonas sp. IT-P100]|uniref:dynamin family protein n=1 Tax=Pseudomonas sp. IT-P100 TaxID=3026452 RepID=UPI0039DF739C
MYEKNIELLREESLRLLEVEIDLLQRMKSADGVVVDEHGHEHQTFTQTSIQKDLQMLRGEAEKLQRLEMVLAVVGTMKAGKSTTINAIVGTEVLPNRNRPMTALPTLIRHTPGQIEPILRLENNGPINAVIAQLHQVLNSHDASAVADKLASDRDLQPLLQLIKENGRFKNCYQGPEGIFWFLRSLNDLVRVAFALDVHFPFESYDEIHEIPAIEVEFSHLAGTSESLGSLTLLDTPGPNEAGQQHLRKMLGEQLKNASAVLAVLDFTQLKSDADEQVRAELERIADVAQGRIFVLVNKFDEKDRNSDDEEQTRRLVADSLLGGRLQPSQVFPVSSKLADLANRARRELAINGSLPEVDGDQNAWVADFGKAALGTRWKHKITDPEEVKEAADALWEDSLFAAPLDQIIRKAHSGAATLAVASAAAKLSDIAAKLNNFLAVREAALGKNVEELNEQINSLRSDIDRIGSLEVQTKTDAKHALQTINGQMDKVFTDIRTAISTEVEQGFKAGKQAEEQQELERKKGAATGIIGILNSLAGQRRLGRQRTNFGYDFDETTTVIKLNDREEAEAITRGIESGVRLIIERNEKRLLAESEQILRKFHVLFEQGISTQASEIITDLNLRLNRSGFSIAINIPSMPALSMRPSSSELLGGVIENKHRTVKRRRRSEGVWGSICSYFDTDDWGWESYTTKVAVYEIDISKVKASIEKTLGDLFDGLARATVETIESPLKDSVDKFFDELKLTVESIRSDLNQSIRDKQSDQGQQQQLAGLLAGFKRNVPGIQKDSDALKRDVPSEGVEVAA